MKNYFPRYENFAGTGFLPRFSKDDDGAFYAAQRRHPAAARREKP
jgi:hypothetical protein